jgi:hypothetical protein
MYEILQGLELRVQAQGNADPAEPLVDMRSARLLSATTGAPDSPHLLQAEMTPTHVDRSESDQPLIDISYSLDTDTEEGLDVKGLLTQLLTFPRPAGGIVPDTWGSDQRAETKRISTDTDSVYTLESGVKQIVNGWRKELSELVRNQKV